jgi:hypothetical protein
MSSHRILCPVAKVRIRRPLAIDEKGQLQIGVPPVKKRSRPSRRISEW